MDVLLVFLKKKDIPHSKREAVCFYFVIVTLGKSKDLMQDTNTLFPCRLSIQSATH